MSGFKKTQQTSQKYILRNIKLFDCRRLIGCFVKRTFSICVRHCIEMCHFPVLRLTKRCNGNKSIFVLKSPFPITTCCDTGAYSTIPKEKERVVSFLILFFCANKTLRAIYWSKLIWFMEKYWIHMTTI